MKNFECKRCGYCCTLRSRLNLIEYLRIYLKGHRDFSDKDLANRKYLKIIDGKCIFLASKNNKSFCKIYSSRPKMCRKYPGKEYDPK